MSESFESVMAFALKTTSTECMNEDMREWCYSTDGCQDCTAKLLNRLQKAHEREMEQMRTEVATRYELDHCPTCEARLKSLDTQYEIERLRKAEYHSGYVAGQRSMDAEHRAVAMRLQGLRFDGGSQENMNKIAYAIYPCATGWTVESCEGLRDKIIDLLGGVHECGADCGGCGACCDCADIDSGQQEAVDVDDSVPDVRADVPAADGVADSAAVQVTYDVLGNERHKAVCRLREWRPDEDGRPYREFWEAVMGEKLPTVPLKGDAELDIIMRDRLIHLLGGDEPTAMKYIHRIVREHDRKCLDMELSGAELSQASVDAMSRRAESDEIGEVAITDELREWYRTTPYLGKGSFELCAIADRIDERFDKATTSLCNEVGCHKMRAMQLEGERDELRKSLRKIADHVGVPHDRDLSDYSDEVIVNASIRQLGQMNQYVKSLEWVRDSRLPRIEAERDKLQAKLDAIREAMDE